MVKIINMNENQQFIYDALKGAGIEVGSPEDFVKGISSEDGAKWAFDTLAGSGVEVGDYNTYLNAVRPGPIAPQPVSKLGEWAKPQQAQRPATNDDTLSQFDASPVLNQGVPGVSKIADTSISHLQTDMLMNEKFKTGYQDTSTNNTEQVKAVGDLKPAVELVGAPLITNKQPEKSPSIGQFIKATFDKVNAGGANMGASLSGFTENIYRTIGDMVPMFGYYDWNADQMAKLREFFKSDEMASRAKANIYKGKDFSALTKEGRYVDAAGEIFLTASESIPVSLTAMAGTMAGQPGLSFSLMAAHGYQNKYDELKDEDMSEAMKGVNSIISGFSAAATEYLGSIPFAKWAQNTLRLGGEELLQKTLKNTLTKSAGDIFKRHGYLFEPVAEGLEEFTDAIVNNVADWATGRTDKLEPLKDAGKSFVYGAAGGAQFTAVAIPIQMANKAKVEKKFNTAQTALTEALIAGGYGQEEMQNLTRGLLEVTPDMAEQQIGYIAGLSDSPDVIGKLLVDFYQAGKEFEMISTTLQKDIQSLREQIAQKQAEKEAEIQSQTNKDTGEIQIVRLMTGEEVPLTAGKLAINPETGKITFMDSPDTYFYRDKEGKIQPLHLDAIDSLVQSAPATEVIAAEKERIAKTELGKVNYQAGQSVILLNTATGKPQLDKDGNIIKTTIQRVDDEGVYLLAEGQEVLTPFDDADKMLAPASEMMPDLVGQWFVYEGDNVEVTGINEDGTYQVDLYDKNGNSFGVSKLSIEQLQTGKDPFKAEEEAKMLAEQQQNEGITPVEANKTIEVPVNKKGEVDYEQIKDPVIYNEGLKQEFGEESPAMLDELIAEAKDDLAKAQQKTNAIERKRATKQAQERLDMLETVKSLNAPAEAVPAESAPAPELSAPPAVESAPAPESIAVSERIAEITAEIESVSSMLPGAVPAVVLENTAAIISAINTAGLKGAAFNNFKKRIEGAYRTPGIQYGGIIYINAEHVTDDAILTYVHEAVHVACRSLDVAQLEALGRNAANYTAFFPDFSIYAKDKTAVLGEEVLAFAVENMIKLNGIEAFANGTGPALSGNTELTTPLIAVLNILTDGKYQDQTGIGTSSGAQDVNPASSTDLQAGIREGAANDGRTEVRPAEQNREGHLYKLEDTVNYNGQSYTVAGVGKVETGELIYDLADETGKIVHEDVLQEEINTEVEESPIDQQINSQSHNDNPTEKQKESGNYDKARVNIQGYNITIETRKGQQRSGVDATGKKWSITMNNHYGELDGTKGYDGDPIDVFIGPNPEGQIFVVDQVLDGKFDESKVMLGFDSAEQAKEAYMSNFEEGWQGFGSITPAGENFKQWLYDGAKQRKPFSEYKDTPAPVKPIEADLKPIEGNQAGDEGNVKRIEGKPINPERLNDHPSTSEPRKTVLPKYNSATEIINLNAFVDEVRKFDPEDKSDKAIIDMGYNYEVKVSYPNSLGERGSYTEFWYKEVPTVADIEKDLIDFYQKEIVDLQGEELPYGGYAISSRDENIIKELQKALDYVNGISNDNNQQADVKPIEEVIPVSPDGLFQIYKSKIRRGEDVREVYIVPSADNKGIDGMGSEIYNTLAEAIKAAEINRSDMADNERREVEAAAERKAAEEAEAARKKANEGKTPTQIANEKRAQIILEKQLSVDGVIKTRAQHIEDHINRGARFEVAQVKKIKDLTRSQYNRMNQREQDAFDKKQNDAGMKDEYRVYNPDGSYYEITKTEYDYAQKLIAEREAAPINQPEQSLEKVPAKPTVQYKNGRTLEEKERLIALMRAKLRGEGPKFRQVGENPFSAIKVSDISEDYDLSEDTEANFMFDLMLALGRKLSGSRYDYTRKGDVIIRVKGHTPNWDNFIEDIEENGAKAILNITVGDYNNRDYRSYKTTKDNFESRYPDIKIIDITVEDGESLSSAIEALKIDLEIATAEPTFRQLSKAEENELLVLGMQLAPYLFDEGSVSYPDFTNALTEALGEEAAPLAKAMYLGVKYLPSNIEYRDQMWTVEKVEKFITESTNSQTVAEVEEEPAQDVIQILEGDLSNPPKKEADKFVFPHQEGEVLINVQPREVKSRKENVATAMSKVPVKHELSPQYEGVFYNSEAGEVAATTGHVLVVVPQSGIEKTELLHHKTGQPINKAFPKYNTLIQSYKSRATGPFKVESLDALINKLAGVVQAEKFLVLGPISRLFAKIMVNGESKYFNAANLLSALQALRNTGSSEVHLLVVPGSGEAIIFVDGAKTAVVMPMEVTDDRHAVLVGELGATKTFATPADLTQENVGNQNKDVTLQRDNQQNTSKYESNPNRTSQTGTLDVGGIQPEPTTGVVQERPSIVAGSGGVQSSPVVRTENPAGGTGSAVGHSAGDGNADVDAGRGSGGMAGSGSNRAADGENSKQAQSPGTNNARNYVIPTGQDVAPRGEVAKIKANIAAVKLARKLSETGEAATPEQMATLVQYTGWGGLSGVFKTNHAYYDAVKKALTPDEYSSAMASTTTAFYTPPFYVTSVWDAVKRLGFKGGTVLEPSAGIGHFFGLMPKDLAQASTLRGVELDEISGSILTHLYPDARVNVGGFEEQRIPNNSIDLVVTNVPFGDFKVYDKAEKDISTRFNIHDYFIAKSVRKLHPGGIGVFITTSSTMDKSTDLRNWVINDGNADFIGAIRLNSDTFKQAAGTEATADIIIIRKRDEAGKFPGAINVQDVATLREAEYETGDTQYNPKTYRREPVIRKTTMRINKYFADNPRFMAGEMKFGFEGGNAMRPTEQRLAPVKSIDATETMQDFIQSLPELQQGKLTDTTAPAVARASDGTKEGGLTIIDGQPYIIQYGEAVPVDWNTNKVNGRSKMQVVSDYIAIKNAVNELLEAENDDATNIEALRKELNKVYDAFVKHYGYLTKNARIPFLRDDVDLPAISAIEIYQEVKNPKTGKNDPIVTKSDMFSRRVISKQADLKAENVSDGIRATQYKYGRVDVPAIAEMLGKTPEEVTREILETGAGFMNPATGIVDDRETYLSGNVRVKLQEAEQANEAGEYDKNVEALRAVIPADIPMPLIKVALGSVWVPTKAYEKFFKDKFDADVTITKTSADKFLLKENTWGRSQKNVEEGIAGYTGSELALNTMNNTSVVIYRTEGYGADKKRVKDVEATTAANMKQSELNTAFETWAKSSDNPFQQEMERTYNDVMNSTVKRTIDVDSFEQFPGASNAKTPRKHQKEGTLRGLKGATLLAHEVGTGKTITLISTAMEMRRLGLAKKPVIVVQRSTYEQFVGQIKELYPKAKVLSPSAKDLTAAQREQLFAKIAYNDWDIVVLYHGYLDSIPDDPDRVNQYIDGLIQEKLDLIEEVRANGGTDDKRKIAQIEKSIESLENDRPTKKERSVKDTEKVKVKTATRAKKLTDRRTDNSLTFEKLGIDALLVDEAHTYKRLGFVTSLQGVKGIDTAASKRAQSLKLKTSYILENNNGKNVVLATGTPISNTMAEMWTFLRYLLPKAELDRLGIKTFDGFVNSFGNIEESAEFTTSGKFRVTNRFASYANVPELIQIWQQAAHTVLTKDIPDLREGFGTPRIEGGKPTDVVLKQTAPLKAVMRGIKDELQAFENLSGKEKKEKSHIPLVMFGLAKRAAIDVRLVNPSLQDDPGSKVNVAVDHIVQDLAETAEYNGTVAVFCDAYQSPDKQFNVFYDMKKKLIQKGVPADQIAVILDYNNDDKKGQLWKKVNDGEVRVVLGTTEKLGVGVNMQKRLHMLVHLDAPQRPSDYQQRNGRIIRQGNTHLDMDKPVKILRIGVEKTLDVTGYQRLEIKEGFVQQIMSGDVSSRTLDEVEIDGSNQSNFGEMMGSISGSQFAMALQVEKSKLKKLESLEDFHQQSQSRFIFENAYSENSIVRLRKSVQKHEKALAELRELFPDTQIRTVKIGDQTYDRIAWTNEIANALAPALDALKKGFLKTVEAEREQIRKKVQESNRKSNSTLKTTIEINGVPVNISAAIQGDITVRTGAVTVEVSKQFLYEIQNLPEGLMVSKDYTPSRIFSEESGAVEKGAMLTGSAGANLTTMFADVEMLISGKGINRLIAANRNYLDEHQRNIDRYTKEIGKPFPKAQELERTREQVADLQAKMEVELAKIEAEEAAENIAAVDVSSAIQADDATDVATEEPSFRQLPVTISINGVEKPTINSEGKQIASSEEGIRNFYNWFRESKVVDEQGRPLVVYHGGASNVTKFDTQKAGTIKYSDWGKGIYFTPSEMYADMYRADYAKSTDDIANRLYDEYVKEAKKLGTTPMDKSIDLGYGSEKYRYLSEYEQRWRDRLNEVKNTRGEVYPVYLNMSKPLRYRYEGITDPFLSEQSINNGNDGIIVTPMTEYIVFSPSQIKSATGNSGEFSTDTDDIRFRQLPVKPSIDDFQGNIPEYLKAMKEYNEKNSELIPQLHAEAHKALSGGVNEARRKYQDADLPIDNLQKFIKEQGGVVTDSEDAYNDKNRSLGRATYRSGKFEEKEMLVIDDVYKKIVKIKQLSNLPEVPFDKKVTTRNMRKVGAYLQAKDIQEAIELGLVGRGEIGFFEATGVTHTDYIEQFESIVPKPLVDALWQAVNDATHFGLNAEFQAGIISNEERLEYMQRKFYVPQRGWDERDTKEGETYYVKNGKVYGDAYNAVVIKAKGRESLASDPLKYIQSMAHSAILTAEKNLYKRRALAFVKQNIHLGRQTGMFDFKKTWYVNVGKGPSGEIEYEEVFSRPDQSLFDHDKEVMKQIAELRKESKEKMKEAAEGLKQAIEEGNVGLEMSYREDMKNIPARTAELMIKLLESIKVKTKVHDDYALRRTSDEKRQHEVEVYERGERYVITFTDERVSNALNNNHERTELYWIFKAIRPLTRFYSALLTQYNPAFAAWNFARDFQLANYVLLNEQGAKFAATFNKNILDLAFAKGALYRHMAGKVDITNATDNLLQQFFADGAATGFTYLKDLDQLQKNLRKEIEPSILQTTIGSNINLFNCKAMGKAFGALTELSEVLTRFAAYQTAIEMGLSRDKAATIAKDVTVNFNRKGSNVGPWTAVFSFFNASVQGVFRGVSMAQYGKSFAGTIAALVALGFFNTLFNPDDPEDEKNWSEYDRMQNVIIFGVKLPLAHFFRGFWAFGAQMALAYQGKKDLDNALLDAIKFMSNELIPQMINPANAIKWDKESSSIAYDGVRDYIPSIAAPIFDVAENKTFTGATVYREPLTDKDKVPKAFMGKRGVSPAAQWVSNTLLEWGGGDRNIKDLYKADGDKVSPVFDVNPSVIEYLATSYTGGVGKFFMDTYKAIDFTARNGSIDATTVPVLNRMVKPYNEEKVFYGKYAELMRKVRTYEYSVKQRNKSFVVEGEVYTPAVNDYITLMTSPYGRVVIRAKALQDQAEKLMDTIDVLRANGKDTEADELNKQLTAKVKEVGDLLNDWNNIKE